MDANAPSDPTTGTPPDRTWRWQPWLSEWRRSVVSAVVAIVLTVGFSVLRSSPDEIPTRVADNVVVLTAIYLTAYLIITTAAFAGAPRWALDQWGLREGRGSWLQRYVLGTAPGPGLSIAIGLVSLLVGVWWLPRADEFDTGLSTGTRVAVGIVLLISAWGSVLVSFAVAYHADNLIENRAGLEFPGKQTPGWGDYVYFSTAVSTTFGTTDVTVASRMMRRTITVHAVLAFVFNTVILGAVVGFLV